MGLGSILSGKKQKENGPAIKELSSQNNFKVLSIPQDQVLWVLEEGEVPPSQNQASEEVKSLEEPDLGIQADGHFRFSPLWIARDDFMDIVSNAWII